jgi:hypothetical protein
MLLRDPFSERVRRSYCKMREDSAQAWYRGSGPLVLSSKTCAKLQMHESTHIDQIIFLSATRKEIGS